MCPKNFGHVGETVCRGCVVVVVFAIGHAHFNQSSPNFIYPVRYEPRSCPPSFVKIYGANHDI